MQFLLSLLLPSPAPSEEPSEEPSSEPSTEPTPEYVTWELTSARYHRVDSDIEGISYTVKYSNNTQVEIDGNDLLIDSDGQLVVIINDTQVPVRVDSYDLYLVDDDVYKYSGDIQVGNLTYNDFNVTITIE